MPFRSFRGVSGGLRPPPRYAAFNQTSSPRFRLSSRIMRAIAPAAHEQQRAGLEALRYRSVAMAQLIAGSCPSDAHLDDPMARFAAAKDRRDVMLFAVMSMSPVLQQLYDSNDKQKPS